MQGNAANLVLLGLLIFFFGLQLRSRKEQPYMGWLFGWVMVLVSYVLYDLRHQIPLPYHVVQCVQIDLLLAGLDSFFLSFMQRDTGSKRTWLLGVLTLGPGMILLDVHTFYPQPAWLYEALAIPVGAGAIFAAYKLVPQYLVRRRGVLFALCVMVVGCGIAAVHYNPDEYLFDAFLVPMLLAISVLYLSSSRSSAATRALGGIGFLLWAEFYAFTDLLPSDSAAVHILTQFWDLPKYFVVTAMILELYERSRGEVERIAERYRLLYENMEVLYEGHPQPMWIYGARSKQILSANAAAVNSYGYSLKELLGMSNASLEIEDDSPEDGASVDRLSSAKLAPGSRRVLHRHKDGDVVSVVVSERRQIFEGKDAIVVLAVDVTEQEKLHQDLFHRAHHDPLTQLPNRELFAERVEQVLVRSERDNRCAVMLTIDVDHFKQINDTHGHPVGDECLKLVAGRLQSRIRSMDTLARTGGEEFTAIIGGLTRREDAEMIADSLRKLFDQPLVLEDRVLNVTVSVGGAMFPTDGATLETLRKKSDDALYRAKRLGRNRCEFASEVSEPESSEFAA
jgi:diguanylate cyclase (GGDEF)-like protein/PAS domain S-box-containing protein